ncbi:hypothetical protein LguiA_024767 [Lonicera macranthoides]
MLIRRISKRVSCISEMISKLQQTVLSPATVCEKPYVVPRQSFASMRVRCFHCSVPGRNPDISLAGSSTHTPISISANRISRLARTEAQGALFDYLHCTRGFHFTDAEHVSKNSPLFLQHLLSKVDNEQDISWALTRFFRYNPINEFEPFFESLGLTPSEYASLLPRNLMFLGDDDVMLDNFHVLCYYGIPRSKIGGMYKEAKEIFGYEYGILVMRLRAYEDLGLSKPAVIRLVCCCPSLLVGSVNNDFIRILETLKGLGFDKDWIGEYLSDKISYNWKRMLDTMVFLTEVGYSETQLGILFKTNPVLLFEGSGQRIYILVGRLLKLGLKMNEVYAIFFNSPQILSPKCTKNLWKAVYFLFEIGMETDSITKIINSHFLLLSSHSLKGPKTVLKSLKVNKSSLCQIIKDNPLKLITYGSKSNIIGTEPCIIQNPSKSLEKTTFLLRLGYIENSDEMAKALKQFRGRGDQLQERFDCLVQAGLDTNVVSNMIKQAPPVLNQSKDVLEKKIDCLRNCLGYPLDSIVAFPSFLCYDIERINLRFSMYVWLRERGKVKPMLSLSTLLACSDARFVRYFVDMHPEGPQIWESLKNSLASSS